MDSIWYLVFLWFWILFEVRFKAFRDAAFESVNMSTHFCFSLNSFIDLFVVTIFIILSIGLLVSVFNFFNRASFYFDCAIFIKFYSSGCMFIKYLALSWESESFMKVMFKIYGVLENVYDDRDINVLMFCTKDIIKIKFCLSAEFISYHWFEVPFLWENRFIFVLKILKFPFKPCKSSFSILKPRSLLT